MRLSNKKRKLAYIREKNFYRTGGFAKRYFKFSNDTDEEDLKITIELCTADILKELEKKFKMEFMTIGATVGLSTNDFINNMTTVKVILKKGYS